MKLLKQSKNFVEIFFKKKLGVNFQESKILGKYSNLIITRIAKGCPSSISSVVNVSSCIYKKNNISTRTKISAIQSIEPVCIAI